MIEEDKSHVGMENCFFCGKEKGIMLDKRLQNTLPRNAVYNKEPCDTCKNVMELGVLFIAVRDGESGDNPYRTGQIVGVKEEAVSGFINDKKLLADILKKRICFVEETVLKHIGLLKKDGSLKYKKDAEELNKKVSIANKLK